MKKINLFISTLLLLAIGTVVTGCNNGGEKDPEPRKFIVSYESAYGQEVPSKEVTEGYKLTKKDLPALTETGYTFGGWDKKAGYVVNSKTVIKAIWLINDYIISFVPNGGSGTMDTVTASYKSEITLPDCTFEPVTGKRFLGWSLTSSGDTVYTKNDVFEVPAENCEFYAIWQEKDNHSITYELNGGENDSTNPVSFLESTGVQIKDPVREGYNFAGWYESAEFFGSSVSEWTAGQKTNDVVLYAKWEGKKYSVSFNKNGGSGEMASQEFTFGTPAKLNKCIFTAVTGYEFAGWSKSASSAVEFDDESSFEIACENTVLYAQWKEKAPHSIIYVLNGGNNNSANAESYKETAEVTFSSPTKTGHIFKGWYEDSSFSGSAVTGWKAGDKTEDVTLYAKWAANIYTVSFNSNGGTGTMSATIFTYGVKKALPANSFTAPVGYKFGGWATTASAVKAAYTDKASISVTKTMTLYAVWIENAAHSITYELNGGKNAESNVLSFKEAQAVSISNPTRANYTFAGWYENSSYTGTEVKGWAAGAKTADVTLYAKWTPVTYTITYNVNGGTNASGAATSFTVESAVIKLKNPSKAGYNFDGWFEESGFTGSDIDSIVPSEKAGNVVLYAKWNPVNYSITYELNSGTNADTNPKTFTVEDAVTLTNPTRRGYIFNGWYEQSDFSGSKITKWAAGAKKADVTLYAKWTANTYTISFNANGGSGTMAAEKFTYGVKKALPANSFTAPAGYKFGGWAKTTTATTATYADKATISATATMTLYALWTPLSSISYTVEHYQQNIEDDNYTVVEDDTVILTGTTGQLTAAEANTYTGFIAKTFSQEEIAGDGTTVVKIYYNRKLCTVNFRNGSTILKTVKVKYKGTVVKADQPSVSENVFAGWYLNDSTCSVKKHFDFATTITGTVNLYGKFIPYTTSVKNIGDLLMNNGYYIPYDETYTPYYELTSAEKKAAVAVMFVINAKIGFGVKNNYTKYIWCIEKSPLATKSITSIICSPSPYNADTATCTGDLVGTDNWSQICKADTVYTKEAYRKEYYPMFDFAETYGKTAGLTGSYAENWYIPSIYELILLYRNKLPVNAMLKVAGAKQLKVDGTFYWSSSQNKDLTERVMRLKMSDGTIFRSTKLYDYMLAPVVKRF